MLLDVQVPFGSAAFFPGKLIHTNEVLVDVGSGLMIECSAAHAQGMMTRRISELGTSYCGTVSLFVVLDSLKGIFLLQLV